MTIRQSTTKTTKLGKHAHAVVADPFRRGDEVESGRFAQTVARDLPPGFRVAALRLWLGPGRPVLYRKRAVLEWLEGRTEPAFARFAEELRRRRVAA